MYTFNNNNLATTVYNNNAIIVLIHRRVENRESLRVSVKAYAFVIAKLLNCGCKRSVNSPPGKEFVRNTLNFHLYPCGALNRQVEATPLIPR